MPGLHHLGYFGSFADELHFGHAALRLRNQQPQLASME
ncbi:hypothetical protein FX983_05980 [Pseudomonas frederiksbergensis]|uniref:Uncharacterized protein n=1 Tax=Pseudomonas frederiksbergensis TaxID=104087 RepID=A0A6L5BTX0_9PSED|nr:hypothetical protein FX983_05980 [Pseudomonas frederiksbergensis]